jgi:predicted dehydrogenase
MNLPFANTKMILVGNGVMGKRHAARFTELGAHIVSIADTAMDADRIFDILPCKEQPFFATIASPASTHADYVRRFLNAGCPVFVEKPLATAAGDAFALAALAKSKDLPLFVGHSERYHPAIPAFTAVFNPEFAAGEIAQVRTRRRSNSERCRDVSVVFDLLIHDLDLLHLLLGAELAGSVQINKAAGNFDSVQAELSFANGFCVKMSADRKNAESSRVLSAYNAQDEELCSVNFAVPAKQPAHSVISSAGDALAREYRTFGEVLRNPGAGHAALESAVWAVSVAEKIQERLP